MTHRQRPEAELRPGFDDVPVPRLEAAFDLVAFKRRRTQHIGCKLARFLLPVALLFVEGKIHAKSLSH
jgi:hypothetical protein